METVRGADAPQTTSQVQKLLRTIELLVASQPMAATIAPSEPRALTEKTRGGGLKANKACVVCATLANSNFGKAGGGFYVQSGVPKKGVVGTPPSQVKISFEPMEHGRDGP